MEHGSHWELLMKKADDQIRNEHISSVLITNFNFFGMPLWRFSLLSILTSKFKTYLNCLIGYMLNLVHLLLFIFHPSDDHGYKFHNCFYCCLRNCLLTAIAVGPIPRHISFIMDGNRRFGCRSGISNRSAYSAGFMSLLTIVTLCNDMGVKYVSVYALSIDNFRRKSELVDVLFPMLQEKIELLLEHKEILASAGLKVNFIGNLRLLPDSIQALARQLQAATMDNKGLVLSLVLAYTSADEITHAVQECCREKMRKPNNSEEAAVITVDDLERKMYSYEVGVPDPDIVVRSSGCTRLSNFFLWQTGRCLMVSPDELWPELSAKTIIWTVLEYQRAYDNLKMKKFAAA